MPDLGEPGVWPAIDIHLQDVIEIPRFSLHARVTARHAEAGLVELRWDDATPGSHAIGISAYQPDHPIRLRPAGTGRAA
jgi:hypothetical protein